MNELLQQAAEEIAKAAGWKNVRPGEDGSFQFSLEGDLDFSLLAPDGKTGILLARLAPAPDAGTAQGAAELERIAVLAAGSMKKRASVLSISESNALELHRRVPLQPESELPVQARDFLNDLAWWKRQLNAPGQGRPAAMLNDPFSFSINDWFKN